jgi:hypothetical protein
MAKLSQREVLEAIADSGAAMSALERVPVEEPRPPKVHTDGPLRGTLVMKNEHEAEDPGAPGKTLADLVREVLGRGE